MSVAQEMWECLKSIGFKDIPDDDERLGSHNSWKYNMAKGDLCACYSNLNGDFIFLIDLTKKDVLGETGIISTKLNLYSYTDLHRWLRKEYPEFFNADIPTFQYRKTNIEKPATKPHQYKVGDKVRILEDATYGKGTTVVSHYGVKSAVSTIGEVIGFIDALGLIKVKLPIEDYSIDRYGWGYRQHQIELVSEYSPSAEPPTEPATLKLRPLEWAFNKSKTILGTIEVYVSGFHYDGEPKYGFQKGDYIDDGIYNSPKEAQQAAEAWYRLSLLSCFEGYTLEEKAVEIVSNVTEFKPLYMHHNSEGQHRIYTQEEIDGFKSNRATDSNEG